tara:strand:+ start:906 stop:1820 length:915 start_codon:yes stop_codon:yes gene_type:complete
MKKITIGSRGSKLSLIYANKVKNLILESKKDLSSNNIVIQTIKTKGDIFKDKKISEIGGKNLFCKEIEANLLNQKIDIAIHSLKDMESVEHNDLVIGSYIKRNDPRDAFISLKYNKLKELNANTIGSGSRRRELQLKLINKDIKIKNIRGNIDTRIEKLHNGSYDGIILALAGLKSLKLEKNVKEIFSLDDVLPSVGQGVIAAQCRKNDENIKNILSKIDDFETRQCAIAERTMLKTIGGDCNTAVGGLANFDNDKIKLKAQLFSDNGKKVFNYELIGEKNNPAQIGKEVGMALLKLAKKDFLK